MIKILESNQIYKLVVESMEPSKHDHQIFIVSLDFHFLPFKVLSKFLSTQIAFDKISTIFQENLANSLPYLGMLTSNPSLKLEDIYKF